MSFVLVHGGGSTARYWDRLVALLHQPVLAVDLPGRGDHPADLGTLTVEDEVASIVADVRRAGLPSPITLVAHSSGGLTVPGVVAGLDGLVERVVLNAAAVPPEGGCGLDCMQPRHRDGLVAALEAVQGTDTVITTPGPPDDPEAFRRTYGGEPLDDVTLAFVVDPARCVSDTVNHYLQPVRWSIAEDVPVTYVLNRLDRPVPADLQHEMAGRLPQQPEVIELDSGHIPAVTMPERFAEILHRHTG
jgi:pimeloyl-ACP methyl ester carboxylesterase